MVPFLPRGGPSPNRALLAFASARRLSRVSAEATSRRHVALLTNRSLSLVGGTARRVPPPECAPFLRARIRPPGWKVRALHVHLRVPVRLFRLLAYRKGFAVESILGGKKRGSE